MRLAQVLIEHPVAVLDRPFEYIIPEGMNVIAGVRVLVSFAAQREIVGYVVGFTDTLLTLEQYQDTLGIQLKAIQKAIDHQPIISTELAELATIVAQDTLSPLISVYQAMLPPSLKPTSGKKIGIKTQKYFRLVVPQPVVDLSSKQQEAVHFMRIRYEISAVEFNQYYSVAPILVKKGVLEEFDKVIYRNPYTQEYPIIDGPPLTLNQQQAIQFLTKTPLTTSLLEGVTGSGKTEVYIQLSLYMLKMGKQVLMLVPEISLTPQMVQRFKERIGSTVAVIHSALSEGEKYDEYRRIVEGHANIVIGARSAIFAPLTKIGLIIIDEEHSESYKQDSTPRYHARQVAEWRANFHHAKLVLGSATPSLESRARALKGVYGFFQMPERIGSAQLPETEIIDMIQEGKRKNYSVFSLRLQQLITDRLSKKEQVILLLNRRGHSPHINCRSCGYEWKCPDCEVALIYHKDTDKLRCHYCNFEQSKPQRCPNCQSSYFQFLGLGTQKLAELLEKDYPSANIARLDRDVMTKKKAMDEILRSFGDGKIDILLGTQMIAKGLDFANVTLVGVLQADTGLSHGFRAAERTFQLLTQVSGRGGRGDKPGITIIQTNNPTHYVMQHAKLHQYDAFFKEEMQYRKLRHYPPYRYLVTIALEGRQFDDLAQAAMTIKNELLALPLTNASVLGPTTPYIARLNGFYRLRLLVKYFNLDEIKSYLRDLYWQYAKHTKVRMYVDFDAEED